MTNNLQSVTTIITNVSVFLSIIILLFIQKMCCAVYKYNLDHQSVNQYLKVNNQEK